MRDSGALYAVARGAPRDLFLATPAGRALAAAARSLDLDLADWEAVLREAARDRSVEGEEDRLFVESLVLAHDDLLARLLDDAEDLEIDLAAASTMISLCCGSAQGDGCCGGGMTCHDGGGCSNPADRLDDGAVRPCGDRCTDCGACP